MGFVSVHDVEAPQSPVPPSRPSVPHVLGRTQDLVEPVLREAAARLPNPLSRAVSYQLGWLDEQGRPVGGGGKGIRPALTLLCAEAAGGTAESAVRAAAAVELVHNFSLAHDDIMDGDTTRRHRRTLWAAFGVPAATLAGDALLALAVDVLATSETIDVAPAVRCLGQALVDLVEGQATDMDFETRDHVDCPEYLAMAGGKTAALIGCACALGAMCAGTDPAVVRQLRQFGWHVGLAFQMVDDVLGIWGDPAVTGKPARSDLRSRKKTFPVVLALTSSSAAGREFSALYRRAEPLGETDIEAAVRCLERTGGRELANREAHRQLDSALRCLAAAKPTAGAAADLAAITRLVTDRVS
jgi:geranylgeranyl diphosphate synthase type I